MHRGSCVGALVALLFLLSGPARGATEEIQVTVAETSVTLTCPWDKALVMKGQRELSEQGSWIATEEALEEMERGAMYTCKDKKTNKLCKIYMKVKVCEGCVDLGLGLMAGIILADLLVTLAVILLVYFCSKGRATTFTGGARRVKPQGQKADSPPPVPNPDYEPIRKGQREVYAGLAPRIS